MEQRKEIDDGVDLRKALIKGARRKSDKRYNPNLLVRVNRETHEALLRLSAETKLRKSTLVREILRTGLVMLGEETAEEIDPLTEFRAKIANKLGVK